MKETFITKTAKETKQLAADLVDKLDDKRILTLNGDLGSGKTTFMQGLVKKLKIKKRLISPTFIIMRSYNIPINPTPSALNFLHHLDLYRINNESEIHDLGVIELMKDSQNLIAIEWPEKIEKFLPKKRINIFFEYMKDNHRKITIHM